MRRMQWLSMKWLAGLAAVAVAAHAGVVLAALPTADVAGSWRLTVEQTGIGCEWVGPMTLSQTGNDVTGSATVARVMGDPTQCPPSLSFTITGFIAGNLIELGFAGGAFGTAMFEGTVDAGVRTMSGIWSADPTAGTWSAVRQAAGAPVLGTVALLGLSLGLCAIAVRGLRRRSLRA
jgi:hypothetical protein